MTLIGAGDGNVPVSRCLRDPGIPPSHVKWLGGTAAHPRIIGVQPDVPRTSGCRTLGSIRPSPASNKKASAGGFIELERVMGIEPTYSAWEADVLPLNYTRAGPLF